MNDYFFLQPFEKEGLSLKNRLVMTAMTRNFADKNHCATDLMREYYERRAKNGIGLILTEGTIIHPSADGYPDVPYIHTEEQTESWKKVVAAVQAQNTKIFCQLWHCGRISDPIFLNGGTPVSSSDLPGEGVHSRTKKPFVTPRALRTDEIPGIVDMFAHAAENALRAGFDGVEVHAGHGYLLDGFFDSTVNNRADEYGGSIENRCRFPLMVFRRVLEIAGHLRTSVRIAPLRELHGRFHDWPDRDAMLDYLIPKLDEMGLRILDISCVHSDYSETSGIVVRHIRPLWPHVSISGASLPPEKADEEIKNGLIDLVTYGRFILANPDFVEKITNGKPLTEYSRELLKTLY
jgi:N-ethylmaleimide reductase